MMKFFKYSNVFFIVISGIGYFLNLWSTFKTPFTWTEFMIGIGFGFAYGAATVAWIYSFKKWAKYEREEKLMLQLLQSLKTPAFIRCPDCGMLPSHPNDVKDRYCGFCGCEFKA